LLVSSHSPKNDADVPVMPGGWERESDGAVNRTIAEG
jgi:hypothetical protein